MLVPDQIISKQACFSRIEPFNPADDDRSLTMSGKYASSNRESAQFWISVETASEQVWSRGGLKLDNKNFLGIANTGQYSEVAAKRPLPLLQSVWVSQK